MGEENCVEDDSEAYMHELTRLYEDKNYWKEKGDLMKYILSTKPTWKNHIDRYLEIFDLARENFNKRFETKVQ